MPSYEQAHKAISETQSLLSKAFDIVQVIQPPLEDHELRGHFLNLATSILELKKEAINLQKKVEQKR